MTEARNELTYIIAEMACSHDGQADLAKRIIDGAGAAGASAIQFQIWDLQSLVVAHHSSYRKLHELELPADVWSSLAVYSRERHPRMDIIACVSEEASIRLAEKLNVDAYKIHAGDLENPGLLRNVAATGRRIDLCVGAATDAEIEVGVSTIRRTSSADLWLMYGYQVFPTPTEAIHLRSMQRLGEMFGLPIGYQDHSDAESSAAFYLPAAAAGVGVRIQEKHITHDRTAKGADYQSALNPDEFARFVQMMRTIDAAMGNEGPRPFTPQEERYRVYARKSVVARRDLKQGTCIRFDDLIALRSEEIGLPPAMSQWLIGKRLRRDVSRHDVIQEEDVE